MFYSKWQNSASESIDFHKPRKTMGGIQEEEKLVLYHNLDDEIQKEIRLKDYKTGRNIDQIEEKRIPDI